MNSQTSSDGSKSPPKFKNRMEKCRFLKKKNEEKWKAYLQKDKARNKDNRKKTKENMSAEEKLKKKEDTRLRVKAWREKQKLSQNVTTESTPEKLLGSYKKKNTLRKAVSKVRRALPFSPKKQKAVIRQLITENLRNDFVVCNTQVPRKKFSEDTKNQVVKWYENDEVSWQAPGKRDYVKVYDPESKTKIQKQKRYMMMTIDEARALFLEKNNVNVSRSKFFYLRPKHVLPVANTPHNVCVCIKHANFSFLVEGLRITGLESNFNHRSLLNLMCCNTDNEGCMTNVCENCLKDVKLILNKEIDLSAVVKWKVWSKVDGKYQVIENLTPLQAVIDKINTSLPSFKFHCYVKNVQSEHFDNLKNKIEKGSAVLQIDYAENFSLTPQDEIQSAHWTHAQVTLFTACIWYENGVKSYVVVSDDMSHSKESSWVFLKAVVNDFKQFVYGELKKLSIFSDNCSAQFKSRYTVSNVCFLATDLDLETVEWSSFAPGHGKGAVDAIGGQLKRKIWIKIKSRSFIINTPKQFFDACETCCDLVTTIFVPKEDVVETSGQLLQGRWDHAQEIVGIQKYHHFQKFDDKHILAAITSRSPLQKHEVIKDFSETNQKSTRVRYSEVYTSSDSEGDSSGVSGTRALPELGSKGLQNIGLDINSEQFDESHIGPDKYVLVKFSTNRKTFFYAAVCQSTVCDDDGEVSVLFLASHGEDRRVFKIDEDGEKYIDVEQIVKILPPPEIKTAGNRVYYEFPHPIEVSK